MLNFHRHNVSLEKTPDGNFIYKSKEPLGEYAKITSDWLHDWAKKTPDAIFIAERSGAGWRELSYAETLQNVRALASGLSARGLSAGDRILVISGNSVNHGLLALATQYIGAAIVPLAEQYALIPEARERMLFAAQVTKPKMVYAEDAGIYGDALSLFENLEIITPQGRGHTKFDDLLKGGSADIDKVNQTVTPSSIAKVLMTSGSSSAPKAVVTTHQMLTANQAQLALGLPFLKDQPPKIVDWLPWNHVFGGSHNFNMMLAHGGALYIDDGKPTPKHFGRTIENLNMQTGNLSFNVPLGYSMLNEALYKDDSLAKSFFSELNLIFYAGASLPQEVWTGLENLALKHRGELPLMTSSWGLTETAPACIMQQEPIRHSGVIGVPLSGVETKLLPDGFGRFEVRVKGPNVMKEYWDAPQKTAEAFDAEGYFITGDAMAFVDDNDPNRGLRFDGRISEEFKLLSGTWVRAGNLRLELLQQFGAHVSDLVITGENRDEIGVLLFLRGDADQAIITDILQERAKAGQSSSTHIARALVLSEPPNLSEGEITAKGNLNFRKILERRHADLERLYEGGEGVILIGKNND